MTKEELLSLLRLLSALETALMVLGNERAPDYLYDQIAEAARTLTREILK